MRRKRTLGVITPSIGEGGCTSPRHTISPRSPASQGTFDSAVEVNSVYTGNGSIPVGGTTSFVGSIIGHDDPTLLHANIKECHSSGINDSATLSSIFTEAASDEIRDSSHISRSGFSIRSISDAEILERELIELDKTQEQWKVRHEEEQELRFSHHTGSEEMDKTGDFYVEEVGGIHRSSARPIGLSLQQQIIFEEDEYNEESSREPSEAGAPPLDQQNMNILGKMSKREIAIASGGAVGDVLTVGDAFASDSIDSSVEDSIPSDLVYEYPSTEESASRGEPPENTDEERHQNSEPTGNAAKHVESALDEHKVDEHVVRSGLYELSFNDTRFGTELQFRQGGTPLVAERLEPSSVQRRRGFKSWIPVYDDSERTRGVKSRPAMAARNDLDDSEVEQDDGDRKRRQKLCLLNICLVLLITAAITCSVLFALTFRSPGDKVDGDGDAVLTSPSTAPAPTPTDENPTFTLIPPNMIPTEAPAPSSTLTSAPEEILSGEPSSDKRPSSGENNNNESRPSTMENTDSHGDASEMFPTSSPTTSVSKEDEIDSGASLPSPTENPSTTNVSGREDTDGIISVSAPPTLLVPSESTTGPAEKLLVEISGDSIYDPETPQYAAFDWLQNEDPANLDLDDLSDQELSQRYVATLFYFSLNGDDWVEKHRFLEQSHVCEWNNRSPRKKMGIVCENSDASDNVMVTKYGEITGIVLSEFLCHRL
jgi:hypothetical protein